MQKFEDTYNYNGFNVKTNGEFARINSVPILKFCMHLLSKTGEWHISTNIVLFSDNQILTVDKFIQPEEKRKSVEYILLFIPENYDWNKRNDQAN